MQYPAFITLIGKFGLVGALATVTYFVTATLMIQFSSASPIYASLCGYVAGMVISFFGQSRFTFGMERTNSRHLLRFCTVSVAGLFISYAAVAAALHLDVDPMWGLLGTVLLIPIASFVMMKLWVFIR